MHKDKQKEERVESHNDMSNDNNNSKKPRRGSRKDRGCVSGWMQVTLPDVPADVMFDELHNIETYLEAVHGVQSLERYDPTIMCKKKQKKRSDEHNSPRPRLSELRKASHDNDNQTLAQAGDCYVLKRLFQGRLGTIHTQFTQVDDDFDPKTGRRTSITNSHFMNCIFTTTHVIERLDDNASINPDYNKPSSSASRISHVSNSNNNNNGDDSFSATTAKVRNSGRGCRWILTYAMVPDGWYGRLYLWRHGGRKRFACILSQMMCCEFSDLHTYVHGKVNKAQRSRHCRCRRRTAVGGIPEEKRDCLEANNGMDCPQ